MNMKNRGETTTVWEQRKLGDLCTLITKQTGFDYSATIKPSLVTTKESDTYSFIQNKDFEGTNINLDTDFYIPISVARKYPKITLDQPSLLISISPNKFLSFRSDVCNCFACFALSAFSSSACCCAS